MAAGLFAKIKNFLGDVWNGGQKVIKALAPVVKPIARAVKPIVKSIPHPVPQAIGTGLEWAERLGIF